MPLTMLQLAAEGLPLVVARLVGRRHYLLAMRVCQALGLPTEEVVVRWACDKISAAAATTPDEQLMEALQVGGGTGACGRRARGAPPPVRCASLAPHSCCL